MNDDLDQALDFEDIDTDEDDADDTLVNGYEDLAKESVEEEEEQEQEEETKETEPEPEPKHKPDSTNTVPQARFNEERIKSKQKDQTIAELQQQLEELKQSRATQEPPKAQPAELKELYKQLKDALFEDDDSHYEIQEKIDQFNAERAEAIVDQKLAAREQARLEGEINKALQSDQQMIDESLAEWMTDYPELDQDSDQFDLELWNDAMTYQTALVSNQKMSGYDALQKALTRFVGKPAVKEPEAKPKEPVIDERTKRSVSRGIEQSKNAAPNIAKETIGNRSQPSGIDVTKMTQDQFDKLSKEDVDRLKGKIK